MGGSIKAVGLGDGSWKFAKTLAKLRLTLPHERSGPHPSFRALGPCDARESHCIPFGGSGKPGGPVPLDQDDPRDTGLALPAQNGRRPDLDMS